VSIAEKVAPYRHARLSAVKLAGDPNNLVRFKDDATAEELRAEMMRRIAELSEAGSIDLQALPVAFHSLRRSFLGPHQQLRQLGEIAAIRRASSCVRSLPVVPRPGSSSQ
jgi:hypothetical protein